MSGTRIVIFAKAPVAGKAKTRLAPVLGEAGAARLAAEMLHNTVAAAKATGLGVELCATPPPLHPEWEGLLPDVPCTAQGEGDLGERLARAAARVIGGGENVLLIGTDCPALDPERLGAAAAKLGRYDAVLHPADDGGYALLGLRRFDRSIFENIAWSTATVAAETIGRLDALGFSLHVAETLRDIDEPEDLASYHSLPLPADACPD